MYVQDVSKETPMCKSFSRPGAVAALFACLLLGAASCGTDAAPTKQARAVQTWDMGPQLAANKKVVVDAARSQGASNELVALLLAVVMAETNSMDAKDRDASKDGTPSANWSAYNVNSAMLQKLGIVPGSQPDLNDQKNLGEATKIVIKAIQTFSEDGFLAFHRGGETAFADRCSYGCQEYIASIRQTQASILADPTLITDGRRCGQDIPHV